MPGVEPPCQVGASSAVARTRSEAQSAKAPGRTSSNRISSLGPTAMASPDSFCRIVSIDPTNGGFGFVVVEGRARRLLDWGVARVSDKTVDAYLARMELIIQKYQAVWLVMEDITRSRRGARARKQIVAMLKYAKSRSMIPLSVSWGRVRLVFGEGTGTKYQIARSVAERFPELAEHLPGPRRPWENEDPRMSIFDALAFALSASVED